MEAEVQLNLLPHEANEGVSVDVDVDATYDDAHILTRRRSIARSATIVALLLLSAWEGIWWETNSVTNGSIRRSIC